MVKDYYYLLGLPRGAPLSDIKKAYRQLAAHYHPDKVATRSPEAQQEATAKMLELNEAIAVLSDPERRADYDELVELIPERKPKPRREARPEPPAPPPPPASPQAPSASPQTASPSVPEVAEPPPSPKPVEAPTASKAPEAAAPKPAPEPATPPLGMLAEEYARKRQMQLRKLPLNWKARSLRGWQWVLEAGNWKRAIVVAHRHLETLSLLSFRSLQATLEALVEQRKLSLRSTMVFALVSYERLMDAKPVQEQLQTLVASEWGTLMKVRTALVLYDGQRAALVGQPSDDPEVQRVARVLLGR